MKNKFYTIKAVMRNENCMTIEKIALATGLSEFYVLEIINNNKLLFNEVVIPLDGVRDKSCYYVFNNKMFEHLRDNLTEAKRYAKYIDEDIFVK